jgi:nicotinate-nucleotide adenylyltransferase
MKIGLFGGSFDPIHNGHLITAMYLLETYELNKIIFIPCYISPHKLDKKYAPEEYRLNMILAAIKGIDFFEASDIEIKKKEISYTIDTLQELKKIYLNDDLYLIIGYDNLLVFDKWKDPDEIFKLAKVIALRRISSFQEANHEYFKKAIIANAPIIQISSSEIRERIKNGKTIKFLVPDSVADYIKANKLYL